MSFFFTYHCGWGVGVTGSSETAFAGSSATATRSSTPPVIAASPTRGSTSRTAIEQPASTPLAIAGTAAGTTTSIAKLSSPASMGATPRSSQEGHLSQERERRRTYERLCRHGDTTAIRFGGLMLGLVS
jgi:hypothetical protein